MKGAHTLMCTTSGLLLLVWSSVLPAQEFEIKTFSSKDGLSADYCFHAYQDPVGYLWIGTAGGLSRFDGGKFTNYSYAEGLPDFRVDAVFMDSNQRLWIGTRRGIAELRGNTCISYAVSDSFEITFVFGFAETMKHEILALTNVGIYVFNDSVWVKRSFYPGYEDRPCRQMIAIEKGIYFNYGNLVVFQNPEGTYSIIVPQKEVSYHYLNMTLAQGRIYISTLEGVRVLNGSRLEPIEGPAAELNGLYTYLIDSKNRFWIGRLDFGLQLCEQNEGSELRTIYDVTDRNPISQIIEDREGTVWMAGALELVRVKEQPCRKYAVPGADSTSVMGIFLSELDQRPTIYDPSTRLMSFDGDALITQGLQWYHQQNSIKREFFIANHAFDDTGSIWCQLLSLDLARIEGHTIYGQEETYAHLGDEVYDVIFDRYRQSVIISMITQDLPCIKGENQLFSKMQTTGVQQIPNHITELHQCIDHTLLLSTANGIIYSIDTNDHCRMALNAFQSKGLSAKFYNDFHRGVWIIFPGRAMSRYVWQGDSLVFAESITRKNGLTSDQVFDMCFDKTGQLWILTMKDVAVFAFDEKLEQYRKVLLFSAANLNLQVYGMNRMTQDTSGKIWIASAEEVLCFDPALLNLKTFAVPSMQIESILINHGQTGLSKYADTLEGIFQLPKNLRLPHQMNTIDIQYCGISASGTEGIRYSYQLLPVNTAWSLPASGNTVSFVSLPPGEYVFNVRSQLTDAAWSNIATLPFEIRKPFWETWWVMSSALLAAGFLLTVSFQYRLRSIRKKTELQDQLRNLESKALSAQMNPHFIHNALNSIQSLIVNEQSQMASQYVNKFAKLLRHVLESGEKPLIPLEQELNALRLYIDLERLRMQMDFSYVEEIFEEISPRHISIPPLILQPFIENALWHGLSRKEGEKILRLSIYKEGDWILCKVTDNGIGRVAAAISGGTFPMGSLAKATSITRARLIAFNNQPDMEPISTRDMLENGRSAGTEVIIHIKKHLDPS